MTNKSTSHSLPPPRLRGPSQSTTPLVSVTGRSPTTDLAIPSLARPLEPTPASTPRKMLSYLHSRQSRRRRRVSPRADDPSFFRDAPISPSTIVIASRDDTLIHSAAAVTAADASFHAVQSLESRRTRESRRAARGERREARARSDAREARAQISVGERRLVGRPESAEGETRWSFDRAPRNVEKESSRPMGHVVEPPEDRRPAVAVMGVSDETRGVFLDETRSELAPPLLTLGRPFHRETLARSPAAAAVAQPTTRGGGGFRDDRWPEEFWPEEGRVRAGLGNVAVGRATQRSRSDFGPDRFVERREREMGQGRLAFGVARGGERGVREDERKRLIGEAARNEALVEFAMASCTRRRSASASTSVVGGGGFGVNTTAIQPLPVGSSISDDTTCDLSLPPLALQLGSEDELGLEEEGTGFLEVYDDDLLGLSPAPHSGQSGPNSLQHPHPHARPSPGSASTDEPLSSSSRRGRAPMSPHAWPPRDRVEQRKDSADCVTTDCGCCGVGCGGGSTISGDRQESDVSASLLSWGDNSSQGFRMRQDMPRRAISVIGRQGCLGSEEMGEILDAAAEGVRSFDRQIYDQARGGWVYVEKEVEKRSQWSMGVSWSLLKARKRASVVDGMRGRSDNNPESLSERK